MNESHSDPSRIEAITTRWTLLQRARDGSTTTAGDARNTLVLRYTPAVRRYVGALVRNDDEADDLAQDVVMRLLGGDFSAADPARGRFRDLLKVAVRNMVRNHWSKQNRRRPADVDVANLGVAADGADEQSWLAAWRNGVLDLAWNALQQEERKRAGSVAYTLLRMRADHPDDSSEQLAARLAEKTGKPLRADAVRQKLHRAREQFADVLIAEIARGLDAPTPARIEEELVELGLLELVRDFLPEEWK